MLRDIFACGALEISRTTTKILITDDCVVVDTISLNEAKHTSAILTTRMLKSNSIPCSVHVIEYISGRSVCIQHGNSARTEARHLTEIV